MLKQAYKKLKSSTYYDKTMAILRGQIAAFEKTIEDDTFRILAHQIRSDITDDSENTISSEEGSWEGIKNDLLNSIKYLAYPKSVTKLDSEKNDGDANTGRIITNYSETGLQIEDYNLFIDADVRLHILGALWVMEIGSILDKELYDKSFGNRLRPEIFDDVREGGNHSPHLFRYYFREYEKWWSGAVDVAKDLTDSGKGAMIMSLDLSSFYYNVTYDKEDFDLFYEKYKNIRGKENLAIEKINDLIFQVLEKYGRETDGVLKKCKGTPCLPIGFLPSNILANYSLKDFDFAVLDKISPVYYGRYVDDMLIVVSMDEQSRISKRLVGHESDKDFADCAADAIGIVCQYFSKSDNDDCKNYVHLAKSESPEQDEKYFFVLNGEKTNFEIKESKIRLFNFAEGRNTALLKIFKKHVASNISEFNLLPYDESIDLDKIDHIYDLDRSDSSIFRGVRDFKVNKYELSKLLGKQLMISRLVDDKSLFLDESLEIFDEHVLMSNMTLWEGLFTYYIMNDKDENIIQITCKIINALHKIYDNSDEGQPVLIDKLIETVWRQYVSALARALSLRVSDDNLSDMPDVVEKYVVHNNIRKHLFYDDLMKELKDLQENMYNAVMFDKRFVPLFFVPKTTFSEEKGKGLKLYKIEDLTLLFKNTLKGEEQRRKDLHEKKKNTDSEDMKLILEYYHEFLPYMLSPFDIKLKEGYIDMLMGVAPSSHRENHDRHIDVFHGYNHRDIGYVNYEQKSVLDEYIECHDCDGTHNELKISAIKIKSENNDKPRIAVASTPLPYNMNSTELGKSLRTSRRYNRLVDITNEAIKNKADILVLPESYVPYEWLYMLSRKSIDNDMAIITGVDYINVHTEVGKKTYNLTAVILPFRGEQFSYSDLELHTKVHYSPEEKSIIRNYRGEAVPGDSYTLFCWKGFWFTTYCCYEIASVEDRGVFTSSVDAVFITENNPDTNYFSSIIDSLARDLHCYCVQVNYSEYGDSRITAPKRTEEKDLIKIKGGKNSTALVDCIDIGSLRKSQLKNYDKEGMFKPVPPGFDHEKLRKRMNGKCPLTMKEE